MAGHRELDGLVHVPMGDWVEQAACKGYPTEWWFPSRGQGHIDTTKQAIAVCETCPVRQECLDYSDKHPLAGIVGIWGGLTDAARRRTSYQRRHGVKA